MNLPRACRLESSPPNFEHVANIVLGLSLFVLGGCATQAPRFFGPAPEQELARLNEGKTYSIQCAMRRQDGGNALCAIPLGARRFFSAKHGFHELKGKMTVRSENPAESDGCLPSDQIYECRYQVEAAGNWPPDSYGHEDVTLQSFRGDWVIMSADRDLCSNDRVPCTYTLSTPVQDGSTVYVVGFANKGTPPTSEEEILHMPWSCVKTVAVALRNDKGREVSALDLLRLKVEDKLLIDGRGLSGAPAIVWNESTHEFLIVGTAVYGTSWSPRDSAHVECGIGPGEIVVRTIQNPDDLTEHDWP